MKPQPLSLKMNTQPFSQTDHGSSAEDNTLFNNGNTIKVVNGSYAEENTLFSNGNTIKVVILLL